jgi:MYXO-CTERM domain-containing protein
MAWGASDGVEAQRAAAWDYVYPTDPNLSGLTIDFSIFPPVYSTHFSLNLIDATGNYREWIWHAGDPGEVPPGQWSTLKINPATGWSNWPTVAYFQHDATGTFDLSSVQILRFNENIWSAPGFPPGPMGNVPPGWVWNAWNHVQVSPEPGTLIVWLALAGLGLGFGCRRRRR